LASLGDYYSRSRYSLYYTDSKRKSVAKVHIEEDDGQNVPRSASSGDV